MPTAFKGLHGSRIRQPQGPEPQAPAGVPPVPAHVQADAQALAAWERYAKTLTDLRVLTVAHGPILGLLASVEADLERLEAEWVRMNHRAVLVTEWIDRGNVTRHRIIANPLKKVYRTDRQLYLQLLTEFGLTPASASKVAPQDTATDPAFERFLAGPKVVSFPPRRRKTPRAAVPPQPDGTGGPDAA